MLERQGKRLIVSINDIRAYGDGSVGRNLQAEPIVEVVAFQAALKEVIESMADLPADLKAQASRTDVFYVGFEGSFGAFHVTPRGLTSELLGHVVAVEGIVSRCKCPRVCEARSLHCCSCGRWARRRLVGEAQGEEECALLPHHG